MYTVRWGGSLLSIHDCDCHQLPDFLSLVPNPKLTERRNSLLLAPRARHPRGRDRAVLCAWEWRRGVNLPAKLRTDPSISQPAIATFPGRVLMLGS